MNWAPFPPELGAALREHVAARVSIRGQAARALLADLQRQIRDWAPVVPLYQEVKLYAHARACSGSRRRRSCNMDFRGVAIRK